MHLTTTTILFALFLLTTLTTAQTPTLLPVSLPPCSQQCPSLLQAQQACIPPGAPVTSQTTYQSCFCHSIFLTSLYTIAPSTLCAACSTGDMASIQNWYKGLCPQEAGAVAGGSTPSSTSMTSIVAPTGTSTIASITASPTSAVSQDNTPDTKQPDWMSTHWRWVLMLILLLLGLAFCAFLAWFLHRRYHRRRAAAALQAMGGQPDITDWRPHGENVHNFGGEGMDVRKEKGKARETVEEVGVGKSGSRRLKKEQRGDDIEGVS